MVVVVLGENVSSQKLFLNAAIQKCLVIIQRFKWYCSIRSVRDAASNLGWGGGAMQ